MTITYPYALSYFADKLPIASVDWDVQRNDELSGTGDGRVWQAQLAPPLWIGTVTLAEKLNAEMKQIAAMIRKLNGAENPIFLYDPLSKYPQSDPGGAALGSSTVQINTIPTGRDGMSLKGLPGSYRLLAGDKIQIAYGLSPVRYAFIEVSEEAVANVSGVSSTFGIFPNLPVGIAVNAVAILAKPACKCIILPGSHNPGTASGMFTSGAGFKVIQKK